MKRRYTKTFCNVCERECFCPRYTAENHQGVSYDICKDCAAAGYGLEIEHIERIDGDIVRVKKFVEVQD